MSERQDMQITQLVQVLLLTDSSSQYTWKRGDRIVIQNQLLEQVKTCDRTDIRNIIARQIQILEMF